MVHCSFGLILLRLSEEMYIQKAEIKNIKSIEHFEIEFPNPAGWHVLIGDNGSGKSTIVRSMALALVGQKQAQGLRQNWSIWLNKQRKTGRIILRVLRDVKLDKYVFLENLNPAVKKIDENISPAIFFERINDEVSLGGNLAINRATRLFRSTLDNEILTTNGFFSVAYGPYRRFEGGNSEWSDFFKNPSFANLAAHLSVFGEDVALTEAISWLQNLNYKTLEQHAESQHTLENLKKLINHSDENGSFLPHYSELENISSEGVFFKDGNGATIAVNQMSDGYRSILSLTFELIRQLVRVYGSEKVFKNIEKGEMFIDLPGVVLVDEIDAHLHPTWQTRIGQWFLKYFPQLQFIVTTHSPLVCRACEKGSIWRLAAPGSDEKSGEITGIDRDRLIYGNVLDAYGTEVFGSNVSISENSVEKQEEMIKLSKKKMLGKTSPKENEELNKLKSVFTTDVEIEL